MIPAHAIFRKIAALLLLGVMAGNGVLELTALLKMPETLGRILESVDASRGGGTGESGAGGSCCAAKPPVAQPAKEDSCCASKPSPTPAKSGGCACCSGRESGCPMGGACRCGKGGQSGEAVAGLFFQMPGCHPAEGAAAADALSLPLSLRIAFLEPSETVAHIPWTPAITVNAQHASALTDGVRRSIPKPPRYRADT